MDNNLIELDKGVFLKPMLDVLIKKHLTAVKNCFTNGG